MSVKLFRSIYRYDLGLTMLVVLYEFGGLREKADRARQQFRFNMSQTTLDF